MFRLNMQWGKQCARWLKAYWECINEGRSCELISTKKQIELEF